MVLYVRNNEETSSLKIIHFYEQEAGLPSELEANAKSKVYHLVISIEELTFLSLSFSLGRIFPGNHH